MIDRAKHADCVRQEDWGKQQEKNKLYDGHIHEGEKQGGHRDRVAKLEIEVNMLLRTQTRVFWAGCVGGFIGGLIGRLVPWAGDAVGKLLGM